MVPIEFQAVILAAGHGTRLPELITNEQPKCLLPIGPYPLLWYPLYTLQRHNFQDVIVIILENQKNQIQQCIEKITSLQLRIDYVTIPQDCDWGTADSLRYIHDKIKSDLIVMSCDVITNTSLYPLINTYRQHNASIAALLFKNFDTISASNMPGSKLNKHRFERDLIGIQNDTQRLLFLASTSDFDEMLEINAHQLRKYKKFNIHSRLIDSHIYIIRKWIIDYLKKKDTFSALKGEFLPYIVKKQMCQDYLQQSSTLIDAVTSECGINLKNDNILQFIANSNLFKDILKSSLYNESRINKPYDGDVIRCYAIHSSKDSIGLRINTTINYYTINMKLFSIWDNLIFNNIENITSNKTIKLISEYANIKSTQFKNITAADNATLSEKTSLNSSVFGENCLINSKVRITNSIIMNHVIIEEGCSIENSIICNHAIVKKGSILQNCIVGSNFTVEDGTKKQAAHLTNADGFMAID